MARIACSRIVGFAGGGRDAGKHGGRTHQTLVVGAEQLQSLLGENPEAVGRAGRYPMVATTHFRPLRVH